MSPRHIYAHVFLSWWINTSSKWPHQWNKKYWASQYAHFDVRHLGARTHVHAAAHAYMRNARQRAHARECVRSRHPQVLHIKTIGQMRQSFWCAALGGAAHVRAAARKNVQNARPHAAARTCAAPPRVAHQNYRPICPVVFMCSTWGCRERTHSRACARGRAFRIYACAAACTCLRATRCHTSKWAYWLAQSFLFYWCGHFDEVFIHQLKKTCA